MGELPYGMITTNWLVVFKPIPPLKLLKRFEKMPADPSRLNQEFYCELAGENGGSTNEGALAITSNQLYLGSPVTHRPRELCLLAQLSLEANAPEAVWLDSGISGGASLSVTVRCENNRHHIGRDYDTFLKGIAFDSISMDLFPVYFWHAGDYFIFLYAFMLIFFGVSTAFPLCQTTKRRLTMRASQRRMVVPRRIERHGPAWLRSPLGGSAHRPNSTPYEESNKRPVLVGRIGFVTSGLVHRLPEHANTNRCRTKTSPGLLGRRRGGR